MSKFKDLTNKKFQRLTAAWPVGRKGKRTNVRTTYWLCFCECGRFRCVSTGNLVSGASKSCGCLRNERVKKALFRHGLCLGGRGKIKLTKAYKMWISARKRAKENSLAFNLKPEDIIIPRLCPLLEIPLLPRKGIKFASRNEPNLDRKNNKKGYIRGNVWVISALANRIKTNASIKELKIFFKNMNKIGGH